MTEQELKALPWRWKSHMSLEDAHFTNMEAKIGLATIYKCMYVPYKNGHPSGKGSTHYMLNGKVFRSAKKLIEHINNLNNDNR